MSSNKTSTVVITDTSCLIILDKIFSLDILQQLFSCVVTTPEIAKEYGRRLPDWILIQKVEHESLQSQFADVVDPGEASAIALAHEIENNCLIVDDIAARKLCAKLRLSFIGTLGLLITAEEQDLIPEVKPLLDQIKSTNFRMSDELYHMVLRKAGEH